MKIRLGLLGNYSYIMRLSNYFSAHYSDKLEVFAFTEFKGLEGYMQHSKIDVLLSEPEFFSEDFLLPKTTIMAYMSESSDIQSINDVRAICKYQKAELIYREILSLYAELDQRTAYKMAEGFCPVLLFMGAAGGVGNTTVAIACAMRLASAGKKVLYLNLEENGVISPFLKGDGNTTLSDVLYAVKSNRSNLTLKLESMVRKSTHNVYFYEPFQNTLDACEMTENDLKSILDTVTHYGAYDFVILDSESRISWKRELLMKYASNVILISDGSEVADEKLEKILREFAIRDEQEEKRLMTKVRILYNRISDGGHTVNTKCSESVVGKIGVMKNKNSGFIAGEIAQKSVFDRII